MMGLTSLQVCMDSTDWLQGPINEETGMDSSSPSGDMLKCARPTLIERRLRPQHDQALNCPRCDSTHTKFCYYNNYSLSQPRYFCKTCRRYWTKGGTLRNIPVGGGCRKNKKVAKKSSTNDDHHHHHQYPLPINHISLGSSSSSPSHHNTTDLQLSFPDQVQFSHLNMLHTSSNPNFMDTKYDIGMLKNPGSLSSSSRNFEFMASSDQMGTVNCFENQINHHSFQGLCSPYGISGEGNTGAFMGTSHRLTLPYDHQENTIDVKPNTKLLSLEWQEQGHESCSNDGGKDTYGYLRNFGSSSWTGMMNDYGSSTANIL